MDALRPSDAGQVAEAVAWAAADAKSLEILGGGTKRGLGRAVGGAHILDVSALAGIELYEPAELVLTAGAGTPRRDIETALAASNQHLAFEPPDLGPIYGAPAGADTIGGIVACNLSGPRRFAAGAARDHFLGVAAVSGRGEAFKSGGRVVKNVTGYDMCKLLAGSYGTLAALTQVTLKVLPAPEDTRTLVLHGLDGAAATAAMTAALASSHQVSGAAHLPDGSPVVLNGAVTLLRVEGVAPSVEARVATLTDVLRSYGEIVVLDRAGSLKTWHAVRDVTPFVAAPKLPLWRLSVPPQDGHSVAARIAAQLDAEWFLDWGGGLVWLAVAGDLEDAGASVVRSAMTSGHATLFRAPDAIRAAVPVFHPQAEPLAALSARVKDGFDPKRILNPGRMYTKI